MIDPVMIGAVPQKRTRLVQASFLILRRDNSNEATPHLIWLWNLSRYAKRSNKPPIYSVNYRLPNSHQRTIRITTVTGNVCFKKTGTKHSSVSLLPFVLFFLKQTLCTFFPPPKVYRWFVGLIKNTAEKDMYLVQLIKQPILGIPNINLPNLRCCKVFLSFWYEEYTLT